MMTDRPAIDWPAIRTEYETTTRPVIAIARDHGVSHTAVNKRARLECWTNPRQASGQVSEPPVSGPAETTTETQAETPAETYHAEPTVGDGLTPRQRQFVREYLIDLNATQAAIRAGYSATDAHATGARLSAHVGIKAAVDAAMAARAERTEITADRVLQEYAKLAFGDPRRLMTWGPGGVVLRDSADLTADEAAMVAEVSQTVSKDGGSIKLKTSSKQAALDSVARHLGMFIDRTEIIPEIGGDHGADIPPRPETREEWMARRERELAAAAAHAKGE